MFCTNCGNIMNDGDKFCSLCGQQVVTQQEVYLDNNSIEEPIYTEPTVVPPPVYIEQAVSKPTYQLMLHCFGGSTFSPQYAYLFLYNDRVETYSIPSKKMERLIYDYIKELGKTQKIKLFERSAYRNQYIETFSKNLYASSDDELISVGVTKEIIYLNELNKVKFQFTSTQVHYGAEDSHSTKTRGYILFKKVSGKSKFTHAYGYNKELNQILQNIFGSLIKIYK